MKEAIGYNGTWDNNPENPDPIPLDMLFELYDGETNFQNTIYFVADEYMASTLPSNEKGWSAAPPNIEGTCEFSAAFLIYDTDASLHPSFSCYSAGGEGCQAASGTAAQGVDKETALKAINDCIGVTTGIVESTLDSNTKKPKLTAAGKKCFIDEKYFNQLFNYTAGVNELTCFDTPFLRTSDAQWSFESDLFISLGLKEPVMGGFYPAEGKTDAIILAADPAQTPLPQARTKRDAEGPVFYGVELRKLDSTYRVPIISHLCKGPGWDKGIDCNGLFATGDETEAAIRQHLSLSNSACVFGWSCPNDAPEGWPVFAIESENTSAVARGAQATYRWTSKVDAKDGNGGRNQHFCAESHNKFKFKKGLTFSIRGNDDIWVFIDNKLAIDIGGTHLEAPGFVDLDKFLPNADVGSTHDIDIFTCDRRTTMSSLNIKTNIFLGYLPKTGISFIGNTNGTDFITNGNRHYAIRYQTSGNPCYAAINGSSEKVYDPDELRHKYKISYTFGKDKTGKDPSQTVVSENEFNTNPKQFGGGIDVSNPTEPIINKDLLRDYLNPGKYYLVLKIAEDYKAIEINVTDPSAIPTSRQIAKESSFRVQVAAPLEISITTNKSATSKFAVMDMKGQVITSGKTSLNGVRVKVPTAGAYVVKVGQSFKQVNVK